MDAYPEIYVKDLSLVVGRDILLRDITARFTEGKIYGLTGRNGSGKTLLMKCICGYVRPTRGGVRVNGEWLGLERDFPESLGVVIESPGFVPYYTGLKNLRILAGLRAEVGEREICAAIRAVGLDPGLKKPVGKYSLGMRQRLGLAQAIMEDPDILILDEPMNGLDAEGVVEMRALLESWRQPGKLVILASHLEQDIELLCDVVYHMEAGRLTVAKG